MKSFLKSAFFILFTILLSITITAQDKSASHLRKSKKVQSPNSREEGGMKGEYYTFDFNNFAFPMDNRGALADVYIQGNNDLLSGGYFLEEGVMYSGGFYISGKNNDTIWANAMATASRTEDYAPGIYKYGVDDSRNQVYVLFKADGDFHKSWDDWKYAVELGAEFYDGDGDGIYNPIDKNNNGIWDTDEDKPDLIGDVTIWCAYHDVIDRGIRRYNCTDALGIEIRQTLFAYETKSKFGNMFFVRYKIVNTGMVNDLLDSVYFSAWCDPDIVNYENDLFGSDTVLKAGYAYDDLSSDAFSPAILLKIPQGPRVYIANETFIDNNLNGSFDSGIDTPLDTAYLFYGNERGIEIIPGAKNLPVTSVKNYIKSNPLEGDANNCFELFNYAQGLRRDGEIIDPCTFPYGEVVGGADCSAINPFFYYSGDPANRIGWLCNIRNDQRIMVNTGPFRLKKDEPVEIIVAYVADKGENSLLSVNEVKRTTELADYLYESNFDISFSIQPISTIVNSKEEEIELIWETTEQVNYNSTMETSSGMKLADLRFEGFAVYALREPINADSVNGQLNKVLLKTYDLKNDIGDVLIESYRTGERSLKFPKGEQIDEAVYSDAQTGRLRFIFDRDPFTKSPIIKGKKYYLAVTSYAINYDDIQKIYPNDSRKDEHYFPYNSLVMYSESEINIIGGKTGITTGDGVNITFRENENTSHLTGASDAKINYSIIDPSQAKENIYKIWFNKDEEDLKYSLYWNMKNETTDSVLLQNVSSFNQTNPIYTAEGIMPVVEWVKPKILDPEFKSGLNNWFTYYQKDQLLIYPGLDLDSVQYASEISSKLCKNISYTDLRRVELRFGENSKAYRYLREAGSTRFRTPAENNFVEVPFSAWIKDYKYNEEYQLTTAFTEVEYNGIFGSGDGVWNPGNDLNFSKEYILIFNSPYNQNGDDFIYAHPSADLGIGFVISASTYGDSLASLAKSPFFNTMYIIGLQNKDSLKSFEPKGTFVATINYTLTEKDTFTFTPQLTLSRNEKKELFDKVNVYPNPFWGYNDLSGSSNPKEQFVKFTNLPEEVNIKIYSLSGALVRTLNSDDKKNYTSQFLEWNLRNENNHRVGSGMYLAVISSPGLGEKILKFAILQGKKFSNPFD
ncbi:MAG: hypothetical protein KJ799_08150 [Bacteroidetes bacterium]|nr:hypothetical protein [Bacteroidota bacterium]